VHLQLLGFNDFHGHLEPPTLPSARQAGGAAALAAYLHARERASPGHTLIVHAGDLLGASPPISALLQNEPAIEFLDLLANRHCHYGMARHFYSADHWREDPDRCNVVGTLGNHEFDAGVAELRRLLDGGNAASGPFLEQPYRGSRVPYVCANVLDRRSGQLLLPPYAVVDLAGIPVGVIGAVLRGTPEIIPGAVAADLQFLDEADAINRAAAQLEAAGVHTLVVIIHQGLTPVRRDGQQEYTGALRAIVARLDPDIDVVVSGHTHNFSNVLLPSRSGKPILVTQAYSYGIAFAQIDLQIDPGTRDVIAKSARIIPTWNDSSPGTPGDAGERALTQAAHAQVAARIARVVGTLPEPMTRRMTAAGESALGDLVADAQRAMTGADVALMNPGGLRSDLPAGTVTLGDLMTLHPFANHLVTLDMTGAQLRAVLEQQWAADPLLAPRILKTSGLYYSWDPAAAPGAHVRVACLSGARPLDLEQHYRVTVNDFLAAGGDGFSQLKEVGNSQTGPLDREALEQYLRSHAPGSIPPPGPRLARADLSGPSVCPHAAAD
jgi:5'-nucleotidase